MKARLHTLEHVYDNSRLVLSTHHVKRLWACLGPGNSSSGLASGPAGSAAAAAAGSGATPGEVSTLLSWLSKACEACEAEGGGGMFEPGVAAELFKVGRESCQPHRVGGWRRSGCGCGGARA